VKGFSFGLEKILDIRKYREKEAQIELGRAIGELAEIENHIARISVELDRAASDQYNHASDIAGLRHYAWYMRRLKERREALFIDKAEAEEKVEEAREIYIAASREKQVLEKLKNKQEKDFKKEKEREETKDTDDMAGIYEQRKRAVAQEAERKRA
jgi:flagellar FliJ protein